MRKLFDRWRLWGRRPDLVWQARVERERSAIGRFSDGVQQKLQLQVPPQALHDLLVALDELLTNVIMHAEQAAGPIGVELRYARRKITAKITYLSDEFDPTTWRAAPAGETIAASRIGGLGIQLVRTLMHEFRYDYVDGRNIVTVVKRC